jgi:hypothetical protein
MGIAFPNCSEELKDIEFSTGEFLLSEFSRDFLQKSALIFFETFVSDISEEKYKAALDYCYDHVSLEVK